MVNHRRLGRKDIRYGRNIYLYLYFIYFCFAKITSFLY
jgi:hypothetical protein